MNRKLICILAGIGAAIVFLVFVLTGMLFKTTKEKPETSAYDYVSGVQEDGPTEPALEGDAGEDYTEIGVEGHVSVETDGSTKEDMVKYIKDYLGYIPFLDGGRFYGSGYFKSSEGIDNRGEIKQGMDSLGYVVWVYRNVFGTMDAELSENPISYYGRCRHVDEAELEIGDVGMLTDKEGEPNHFGIFVGRDHGIPVFAHCSGQPAPKYPCGNDRLSLLKTSGNLYFMGNAPVEFHFFFRPDVAWEVKQ